VVGVSAGGAGGAAALRGRRVAGFFAVVALFGAAFFVAAARFGAAFFAAGFRVAVAFSGAAFFVAAARFGAAFVAAAFLAAGLRFGAAFFVAARIAIGCAGTSPETDSPAARMASTAAGTTFVVVTCMNSFLMRPSAAMPFPAAQDRRGGASGPPGQRGTGR